MDSPFIITAWDRTFFVFTSSATQLFIVVQKPGKTTKWSRRTNPFQNFVVCILGLIELIVRNWEKRKQRNLLTTITWEKAALNSRKQFFCTPHITDPNQLRSSQKLSSPFSLWPRQWNSLLMQLFCRSFRITLSSRLHLCSHSNFHAEFTIKRSRER